jgi:tetratricopeptide (TPR) repeat protein
MKTGNVILFPKWQKVLEEESVEAIKEKRFEEALEKLDNLLSYQVKNHDIYTGKLICLMELERYDEAQELCESLIEEKDQHYYQYIHIYLTLLFQTNQYDELIQQLDDLKPQYIPEELKEPFKQLYQMSKKMRLNADYDKSNLYLEALYDAVNQDNHSEQRRLVQQLKKLKIQPTEKVKAFLVDEHVHPLVKSEIYLWLKEVGHPEPIAIHKFGVQLEEVPIETQGLQDNDLYRLISERLVEVEQQDPSLATLMRTLLLHYLSVLYPIIPPKEDALYIAEALFEVGTDYLNSNSSDFNDKQEKVKKYIQEIKTTDLLYATIADD